MLVKIKVGDKTLEFDSQKHLMAILLTPSDKQSIDNMKDDQQLIVSGPVSSFQNGQHEAWQWAMTGWKGAKHIPGQLLGANGGILKGN